MKLRAYGECGGVNPHITTCKIGRRMEAKKEVCVRVKVESRFKPVSHCWDPHFFDRLGRQCPMMATLCDETQTTDSNSDKGEKFALLTSFVVAAAHCSSLISFSTHSLHLLREQLSIVHTIFSFKLWHW